MNIRTTTKIFGSFSESPGNNGATFFNDRFQVNNIDAIYLPIKCDITADAVHIMKLMNFQGASFSKPHKETIIKFLNELDTDAENIGAVNTVIIKNNKFIGFNTDWIGVYKLLKVMNLKHLYIYGNGGFSKSVQYACSKLDINFTILDKTSKIPDQDLVFNATPVELSQSNILDGRPFTEFGLRLFKEQATVQYQLYTGMCYEGY